MLRNAGTMTSIYARYAPTRSPNLRCRNSHWRSNITAQYSLLVRVGRMLCEPHISHESQEAARLGHAEEPTYRWRGAHTVIKLDAKATAYKCQRMEPLYAVNVGMTNDTKNGPIKAVPRRVDGNQSATSQAKSSGPGMARTAKPRGISVG